MKKLTLLSALLIVACTSTFAQTKDQIIAEWTRAKAYTKTYLDAMPADGYAFKATPEVKSFAQQMLHLAAENYLFGAGATGKTAATDLTDAEKKVTPTKEATTKAVLDSYDYVIAAIKTIPVADMNKEVTFYNQKSTAALLLLKGFEHQTHHRGQTTVYLRLKGVTPPQEMLF
jgi:uncharacterized damage-inducible protein DinB